MPKGGALLFHNKLGKVATGSPVGKRLKCRVVELKVRKFDYIGYRRC